MIALHLAVQRPFDIGIADGIKAIDNGVRFGIGASFGLQNREIIKRPLRSRQIVDPVAAFFAFAASNAARIVK